MTQRLGRFRYRVYEFPKLEIIQEWSHKLLNLLLNAEIACNSWEEKFIKDMAVMLNKDVELSEDQVYRLEQLYAKFTS